MIEDFNTYIENSLDTVLYLEGEITRKAWYLGLHEILILVGEELDFLKTWGDYGSDSSVMPWRGNQ